MASSTVVKTIPPTSFGIAFDRLQDSSSKDDARSFESTTMKDVWTTAKEIERQLQLRQSLRGFRRITPFLSGIEQYSAVIEVLCQGTPYLPYIWAPIKLLLQIAQGHISALEKLIDAYAMIGEAMPRFDKLSTTFAGNEGFQQVMGLFYSDILDFHGRAYKFFRQRAWKMVFDSLWKTFNPRFQGILESLRKHIEKVERERLATSIREAVAWLDAHEQQEDGLVRLLRASNRTNDHWALKEPGIVSWIGQGAENPLIWLNGKPGAGKRVVCSKIIEHLQAKTDSVVVYYFCTQVQSSRTLANELLRNLATQLLAANSAVAPYVLETYANNALRPTKKSLGMILEKLVSSFPSVRIVVDGLDECPQSDQKEIMEDLLKIKGFKFGSCKILISSRNIQSISKVLRTKSTVRLDDYPENVNDTIATFVKSRLQSLSQEFTPGLVEGLGRQLIAKANGMFLWVKLVLSTFEESYTERDLQEAIETFPEDLETLYERLHRTALRILQWMLVARRPLRKYELESGIALDWRTPCLTSETRIRGEALNICNPILDIDDGPGGFVSFSHFTAIEYLRGFHPSPILQQPRAHLAVALSCVLYLASSLELVDPRIADEQKVTAVEMCLHDVHSYANDHWLDHIHALMAVEKRSILQEKDFLPLCHSIEELTHRYNEQGSMIAAKEGNPETNSTQSVNRFGQLLGLSANARRLLTKLMVSRKEVSSNLQQGSKGTLSKDQDSTLLTFARDRYNSIVEELLERPGPETPALREFRARHSWGGFLCHYPGCSHAADSSELRHDHEQSHTPRFKCTLATCGFFGWPYKTRDALLKHNARYHDEEKTKLIPEALTLVPPSTTTTDDFNNPDILENLNFEGFLQNPIGEDDFVTSDQVPSVSHSPVLCSSPIPSSTFAEPFAAIREPNANGKSPFKPSSQFYPPSPDPKSDSEANTEFFGGMGAEPSSQSAWPLHARAPNANSDLEAETVSVNSKDEEPPSSIPGFKAYKPAGDSYAFLSDLASAKPASISSPSQHQALDNDGQRRNISAAKGNLCLEDYQLQLMLLEQQNKKRLLFARAEYRASLP